MSKKIKIKPKLNKSANSDWEIVDDVSMKGYSDNSPYRNRKSIDIHSPNGLIDMSETGMPFLANGKFLPPYSGMHQFEPGVVREERIMQNGGNFKNYNWKENREYKNNLANLNSSGGLDVGVSKNLPLGLNSSVGVGFDEDKVNYRAGLGYNNNGLRVNTDYNSSGRLNASVNYNSPIGLNAGFRYSDNKGEETYSGNVGYRGEKIPVGLNAEYIHTPKGHNANANLNFNTKNINGNFGYEYNQGGNNHSFNTGVNIPFLGGMGDIGINSKYNIGNKQPSVNVGGIFKFQDGGSIPIMQTGGRAPLEISDPREFKLRQQAYQDSLDLYKTGEFFRGIGDYNPDITKGNQGRYYSDYLHKNYNKFTPIGATASKHINQDNNEEYIINEFPVYAKPVQPVVYKPKKEPTYQLPQLNTQISQKQPELEFNPIPYEQGTYFSRPRQQQEIGGTDYFDKKTGKKLGTFKKGGKISSDWEIIQD